MAAKIGERFGGRGRGSALGHDCAAPTFQIEPPLGSEEAIGFGNGVEMNPEFEAEVTDGGEGCARLKGTLDEEGAEVVDYLPVDRDGGVGIDDEFGGGRHLLFVYIQCTKRNVKWDVTVLRCRPRDGGGMCCRVIAVQLCAITGAVLWIGGLPHRKQRDEKALAAFEGGDYSTVEGIVTEFDPMPFEGSQTCVLPRSDDSVLRFGFDDPTGVSKCGMPGQASLD